MSHIDAALRRIQDGTQPEAAMRDPAALRVTLGQYAREFARNDATPDPALDTPVHPAPAPPPVHQERYRTANPEFDGKLVTGLTTKPLAIEQYRRLAAALHETQVERGIRTVMFTSAAPMEGKTITISNVALTLSESYRRRVLLVDADLRNPALHERFGVPNANGLSDALRTAAGTASPVVVSSYLSVLPAGEPDPNPSASLTSERMHRLIKEAAESYEWVLVDSPPVSLLPDAHHVARLVDGVVVVIAAGVTSHGIVERALTDLDRDRILGIVLNRAADSTIGAAQYYRASN